MQNYTQVNVRFLYVNSRIRVTRFVFVDFWIHGDRTCESIVCSMGRRMDGGDTTERLCNVQGL